MNISGKLRGWARRIKRDGVTLWFAGKHPATPWYAKAIGLFVVAYALSPIDLIPDFIPVLGYLDELILLPVCIYLILRMVPPPVLTEARARAGEWISAHKPKPRSIIAAIVIMLLWMIFFGWLWKLYGSQILEYLGAR